MHACVHAFVHTHTKSKGRWVVSAVVVKRLETTGLIEMYFDTDVKTLT